MTKMTTRTKIYLRNKKGVKKGLLIWTTPNHISQAALEEFRTKFNAAMNDPDRPIVCLNLPPNSKWQYIDLSKGK